MDKKPNFNQKKPQGDPTRFSPTWLYFLILMLILSFIFLRDFSSVKEITWKEFQKNMLNKRAVEKIEIVNNELAQVYIKKQFADDTLFKEVMEPMVGEGVNPGPHFQFNIGSVESFEKKWMKHRKIFLRTKR